MHHVDPHADTFRTLEAQMCEFVPGVSVSPDRMDALVWAVHELFLKDGDVGYSMFNDRTMVTWNQTLAQMGYTPERLAALRRWPF